jgi:hypothetical protein
MGQRANREGVGLMERLTYAFSRRAAMMVVAATVIAMLAGTVGALAANRFGDVPANHPHAPGIGFVADAGVTAGCGDGSNYCPGDPVTRAQMGTFMHRLAGHAPGVAPSVDAATVQGFGPEDLQGEQGPRGPEGPQGEPGRDGGAAEVLRHHDESIDLQHPGSGDEVWNTLELDLEDHCGDGTTVHQVLADATGMVTIDEENTTSGPFNFLRLAGEEEFETVEFAMQTRLSTMDGTEWDVANMVNKRLFELGPGLHELESVWAGNGLPYIVAGPTLYATVYGWTCTP